MFTMKIVDSDAFLSMSAGAQCAYFHLCMRSDNDGYLRNWKRIFQIIGIEENDVCELIENGYLRKNSRQRIRPAPVQRNHRIWRTRKRKTYERI